MWWNVYVPCTAFCHAGGKDTLADWLLNFCWSSTAQVLVSECHGTYTHILLPQGSLDSFSISVFTVLYIHITSLCEILCTKCDRISFFFTCNYVFRYLYFILAPIIKFQIRVTAVKNAAYLRKQLFLLKYKWTFKMNWIFTRSLNTWANLCRIRKK